MATASDASTKQVVSGTSVHDAATARLVLLTVNTWISVRHTFRFKGAPPAKHLPPKSELWSLLVPGTDLLSLSLTLARALSRSLFHDFGHQYLHNGACQDDCEGTGLTPYVPGNCKDHHMHPPTFSLTIRPARFD